MTFSFGRALALPAAVIAVLMISLMPSAEAASNQGWVYTSSTDCHWAFSSLTTGSDAHLTGYAESYRAAYINSGTTTCASPYARDPGHFRNRIVVWKLIGSDWYQCLDTGFVYNTTLVTWMDMAQAGFAGASYCGGGTYRTQGIGADYRGAWHGGSMWSGPQSGLNPPINV